MFRTLGVATLALVSGIGIGFATGATAQDQPRAATTVPTRTPVACLLALESAWKTINPTLAPPAIDHKAEFDASYGECLQAS